MLLRPSGLARTLHGRGVDCIQWAHRTTENGLPDLRDLPCPSVRKAASRSRTLENADPFMRGIMIHSLMARGIAFDEAFHAANEVRSRVGDRAVLEKSELAKMLREILGPEPFAEDPRVPLPGAEITVMGRGKGVPFSKGHLSQSAARGRARPQRCVRCRARNRTRTGRDAVRARSTAATCVG